MALPGDAASLRFHLDADTGACMIHDPHRRTLAAVVEVSHPAYVLLGADQQHGRVAGWGRALAALAQSGEVRRDPGSRVHRRRRRPQRSSTGTRPTGSERGTGPPTSTGGCWPRSSRGASTHRSTISLAVDLRRAGKAIRDAGGGLTGAAHILGQDMAGLEARLARR